MAKNLEKALHLLLKKPMLLVRKFIPTSLKQKIVNLVESLGYEIHKREPSTELPDRKKADTQVGGALVFDEQEWSRWSQVCRVTPENKFIVTQIFWRRLSSKGKEKFDQFLAGEPAIQESLASVPQVDYRREVLRYGTYHFPETYTRETGLTNFSPPEEVHAMVRHPIYAGDFYYCDLITEALDDAGYSILPGKRYLDFGCSSGRVVRNLSLAYPEASFFGCDPIPRAIEWAAENINHVRFELSQQEPPTPYSDNQFDMVYAISIWSHFGKSHAQLWFDEMYRILTPGGLLVWTTHGLGSVLYYRNQGELGQKENEQCMRALLREGFHIIDVFGAQGDWGLDSTQWGQAFIHPCYVVNSLLPNWKLLSYRPRRAENNQDVYVFEKV